MFDRIDWTQVVINGGGVFACFASLCYVIFLLGRLMIDRVGRPWLNRHIAFVDSLEARLDSHTRSMKILNEDQEIRNEKLLTAIDEQTAKIVSAVNESCKADPRILTIANQRPPKPA